MANRWHQAEDLYQAALERPANQRAAFLLEATDGDDALRLEVESLLSHQSEAETRIELPASEISNLEPDLRPTQGGGIVGKAISHYRVIEKLGAGGMGVVYRAHDVRLDRDVALKVLPAGRLAGEAARNRFHKEALALAKLNQPHIGAIYDFDRQEGVDFLVMEYVPGKSLAEQLAAGPLPESEVRLLGTQIVTALEEAHQQGIVHRDLKPGNIVVTPKGQAKVLDFGLAKLLRPASEMSTADEVSSTALGVGTLPYMAPEQLRGLPADALTDIYAAGAVLYEMVTGRRPFRNKFAVALAADIQTQLPAPPRQLNPKISLALEEIILKCLEKEPRNRYQSAEELLVDLRRLNRAEPQGEGLASARSRFRFAAWAVGALVIALLAGTYLVRRPSWIGHKSLPGKIILAVLPFENLSHDPQEDYFCDGLTDEMINQLGRLMPQQLGVIARTSAMRYKGSQKRIDEIGRELHAGYILETSVRNEGAHVRIATQLIQARDQTTLWTETYDYDVAGVFALESDVSGRIARSLALQLLPAQEKARPQTASPEAHDAYLKGRYHWQKGSVEEHGKARQYFEEAVRLDPRYAPAYAGLAGYYSTTTESPAKSAMPIAKQYALKSLELDDSLSEAHTAFAGIRFYGDWDWPGAESEFKRALALNPSDAEARRGYSNYLLAMGRFEEALLEVQRAQELDPLSLYTSVNAGWTFYFARQYDRAIEQCRKALELDANSDGAYACLGWSYRAKGLRQEAIAESERAVALSDRGPGRLTGLARAYAAFGRKADAGKILDELGGRGKHTYVAPHYSAMIYAALGENDQALAAMEQAYVERDGYLAWLKVDDAFDSLRKEPRFQELLSRVGFAP
jgi:serine/threonine protein kinase/TolB-like protein/Tfp pilus assembly protein PilF